MEPIETFEHAGLTVTIEYDEDPPNPRTDYDNAATIALYDRRRYAWGDDDAPQDPESIAEAANAPGVESLPVWIYEHSGVALTTGDRHGQFADPWDGGQAGYVYMTPEQIRENFMVKRITKQIRERARQLMRAEVATFNDYINGRVYEYVIEDEDGNYLDSCSGFFEDPDSYEPTYTKQEAIAAAEYLAQERAEQKARELDQFAAALSAFDSAPIFA